MNQSINHNQNNKRSKKSGFTLIEILVVMVILGILGAIAVPKFFGQIDKAYTTKVKQDIQTIQSALDIYRLNKGDYPGGDEGLTPLVPDYVSKLPLDPWNNAYVYLNPGSHGEVDIYTLGKDNASGGTGNNTDIGNW